MKKLQVRCWRVSQYRLGVTRPDELFVTYPEDNSGHSLITCLSCGELFAVTVAKEVYIGPPLETKVLGVACPQCGSSLSGNWAYYPDTYVVDGRSYSYDRPAVPPPDEDSELKDLNGIYE